MNDRIVWLVSNDQLVVDELRTHVTRSCNCELAAISFADFLSGDFPVGTPQWILFDLRDAASWDDLPTIAKRMERGALVDSTRLVIVDQGYPISVAATADKFFDHFIHYPGDLSQLPRHLDKADVMHKVKTPQRNGGFRELVVGENRYFTYTPALFPLFEKIERAAHHDFTILLVGGTGTGKTTFAKLVHDLSQRKNKRFLTAACGAMPRELMGSELFGHVRGAFTGADRDKDGKFTAADQGTLLLDEIDVLDLEQQANLLRVIETGEFERVGSNDTIRSDVRTIVASNIRLEDAIEAGRFRADLYFRLNEVKFEIPLLKDRPFDIATLATDIIQECTNQQKLTVEFIEPSFFDLLRAYSWPGNIRELRNEVRHAALFCTDGVISSSLLSNDMLEEASEALALAENEREYGLSNDVAKTEQESIEDMLHLHDFNRAATARALGISRVTLYNKIRKYQIKMD